MTTEELLRYHAIAYPIMRPTDAVKLLYQNEFGGGHLIKDSVQSLAWIENEYSLLRHESSQPLTVPVGNGIVRYNLFALDTKIMPLTRLNEIFVESSRIVSGCRESFLSKLKMLHTLTDSQIFMFSSAELDAYLAEYEKQGYPLVSHSSEYRQAYAPAYRIVLEELI